MSTFKITVEEFDARREIARFPECPDLAEDKIKLITETVFVPPNPQPADILFVFGSSRDD